MARAKKATAATPLARVKHPATRTDQAAFIAEYNKLVGAAKLDTVSLVKSTVELHTSRLDDDSDEQLDIVVDTPEYKFALEKKSGLLQCGARLKLAVGDEKKPVIEILAEYVLTYKVPTELECSDRVARLFAGRNGVFNAWPFFREFAHASVARMSLPPLIVPLLRLGPLPPK